MRTSTYRSRDAFAISLVLLLVAIGVFAVWSVPLTEVAHLEELPHEKLEKRVARLKAEDDARKTIAQIVLGVFGLLILYFTWRRAQIMAQGHITDRFAKAIEQLGKLQGRAPNLESRLGAIYALERIAMDSPRDHWSIMEILTAYVRANAPFDPQTPYVQEERPRADIQAIVAVLGRRRTDKEREQVGPGRYLDLSRTRLCGARFTNANLDHADLSCVDLRGASLWNASLLLADLRQSNLSGANLTRANFKQAHFEQANLSGAKVEGADFSDAVDLTYEQLQSALAPAPKGRTASSQTAAGL